MDTPRTAQPAPAPAPPLPRLDRGPAARLALPPGPACPWPRGGTRRPAPATGWAGLGLLD